VPNASLTPSSVRFVHFTTVKGAICNVNGWNPVSMMEISGSALDDEKVLTSQAATAGRGMIVTTRARDNARRRVRFMFGSPPSEHEHR